MRVNIRNPLHIEYIFCLSSAVFAGLAILVFYYYNDDSRKIERFYYNEDRQKYVLLQIVVFVLTMTAILNARFLASELFKFLKQRFMS